jgi:hypothetical protein
MKTLYVDFKDGDWETIPVADLPQARQHMADLRAIYPVRGYVCDDVPPTVGIPPECSGGCLCSAWAEWRFLGAHGEVILSVTPEYWTHESHGSPADAGTKTVTVPSGTVAILVVSGDTINGGREWRHHQYGDPRVSGGGAQYPDSGLDHGPGRVCI